MKTAKSRFLNVSLGSRRRTNRHSPLMPANLPISAHTRDAATLSTTGALLPLIAQ